MKEGKTKSKPQEVESAVCAFTNCVLSLISRVRSSVDGAGRGAFLSFFSCFTLLFFSFSNGRVAGVDKRSVKRRACKAYQFFNWNLARSYEAWPSRSAAWLTRAGRPTQPAWTLLARRRRAWRRQARARPWPRSARSPRPRSARSRWRGAPRCGRPAERKVCKCAMRMG